ncbi:MAG: hypothetical protein U1F37_08005 [Alphaproteobacteria bacterium]
MPSRFCTPAAAVAAALAGAALATPCLAQGKARIVDCRVEAEGKVQVSGKCRFIPDEGGSFTLEHAGAKRAAFFGEIMSVTVSIVSPGVAEVRGLTRQGVNSRWGEARRMAGDRACWQGSDFKICAR